MCDNQIIQDDGYACFSMLGLVIIFGVGGVLIFINLTLRPLTYYAQTGTVLNSLRREEWDAVELLELQRRLYKAEGIDVESGKPFHTHSKSSDDEVTSLRPYSSLADRWSSLQFRLTTVFSRSRAGKARASIPSSARPALHVSHVQRNDFPGEELTTFLGGEGESMNR